MPIHARVLAHQFPAKGRWYVFKSRTRHTYERTVWYAMSARATYSVGYGSGIAPATLNFEMSTGVPDEAARRRADAIFADWTAEFYRDPAIRAALEQAVLAHLTRTKHEPFELQVAPR